MQMKALLRHALLLSGMFLLGGCAARAPAPPAAAPAGAAAPADEPTRPEQRVKIEASTRWEGQGDISGYVTPVKVHIENDSNAFLRIAYEQFALIGADGHYFAALPWFPMQGAACDPQPVSGSAPVSHPAAKLDGLSVPTALSAVYPSLPSFNGTYCYAPRYQAHYHDYWESIPVPTGDMVQRLVPEGILAPGGQLTGYLYFEHVPSTKDVRLRAELENAFTAERLATRSVSLSG